MDPPPTRAGRGHRGTHTWMSLPSVEYTLSSAPEGTVDQRLATIRSSDMHKLAFPAPAPPALGSAAEPAARACACAVCGAPLDGARALRCAQCACGPFHPGCALPISGSQPRCPRCAQLVAARVTGGAAAHIVAAPRMRVDLTGERGAVGIGAGAAGGGGGRGGGGARGRRGHGKQRGKCRECREGQGDGAAAQEQQANDGAEQEEGAGAGSGIGRGRGW